MNALVINHGRSFSLLIFLFVQLQGFGQLKADFSASPVSACAPIVVQFTDLSTGDPVQWKWDLGNGVTSVMKSPSATYFTPGTYNVKLVIRNSSSTDSVVKNQFITVQPSPLVNFTASDSAGCAPLKVNFKDLSTSGDGTISKWNWDFGDGSVSTLPNPTHTYKASGNYTVILNVTNSFGCTKTFTKSQYIKVTEGVKADFQFSSLSTCTLPSTVTFTNKSTGPGTVSYTWNFGDGAQSALSNPVHIYTTAGSYSVGLIANSSLGCSDSITKKNLIYVGVNSSKISAPAKGCVNQAINFKNQSAPTPAKSFWSFGDGTSSTEANPVKSYNAPGTYTIKLVNDFDGCTDSVTQTIVIE
ncbi:MAG TPA: PKD domain-containing protein, partial [Flavisolibacter sp.]|nr:PKD domain-containing protein [Flavisolibacter sp.]